MKEKEKYKWITRHEYGTMYGWNVRRLGEAQYFSDKKYGGKEAGLVAARVHLKSLIDSTPDRSLVPVYGMTLSNRIGAKKRRLFYLHIQLKKGEDSVNLKLPFTSRTLPRVLVEALRVVEDWCEKHPGVERIVSRQKAYGAAYGAIKRYMDEWKGKK